MTVSAVTRKSYHSGSGTTGPFTVSWKLLSSADISVKKIKTSDGTVTSLVVTTDYTISLVAGGAGGASITTVANVAAGETLVIMAVTPKTQATPYGNQGAFYGARHEASFDKMMNLIQELQEQINRCIKIPFVDPLATTTEVDNYVDRANTLITFDANGHVVCSADYLTTVAGYATAAAASAAAAAASACPMSVITADQNAAVNNAYVCNKGSVLVLTLPTTSAVGDILQVFGMGAGGWRIAQNASQNIQFGSTSSTAGTGGKVESTNRYDTLMIRCVVANTTWQVLSSVGNFDVT